MYLKKSQTDSDKDKPLQQKAVALGYTPSKDAAPRVLASGQGLVAQKIIQIAKENNVPIREDPVLAAALSSIDLEEAIPPELYAVVAEMLAYIYRIREKQTKKRTH